MKLRDVTDKQAHEATSKGKAGMLAKLKDGTDEQWAEMLANFGVSNHDQAAYSAGSMLHTMMHHHNKKLRDDMKLATREMLAVLAKYDFPCFTIYTSVMANTVNIFFAAVAEQSEQARQELGIEDDDEPTPPIPPIDKSKVN